MKTKILILTIIAALLALWPTTTIAELIECEVLQYKHGRVYLNCGEEANVFAGARAAFEVAGDSLVEPVRISMSLHGISISDPIAVPDDTTVEGRTMYVESAEEIDGASLRLGSLVSLDLLTVLGTAVPANLDLDMATEAVQPVYSFDDSTAGATSQPNRLYYEDSLGFPRVGAIEIEYFLDSLELAFALENGDLDGYLAYQFLDVDRDYQEEDKEAPYIAVLVPNLAREINDVGALTTSLYYRFDHEKLTLYFRGRSVQPVYAFLPDHTKRLFYYDPVRGSRLFGSLPGQIRSLRLHVSHPELSSLARYFSDILSRDRCRTRIVADRDSADFRLEFVPVDGMLDYLLDELATDTVAGSRAAEAVAMADKQLVFARMADSAKQETHLKRLNAILINDLGVFPLFRPTLFLATDQAIKGAALSDDGYLDLSTVRKVRLPGREGSAP